MSLLTTDVAHALFFFWGFRPAGGMGDGGGKGGGAVPAAVGMAAAAPLIAAASGDVR